MGILNVALQEEKRSRAELEPLELKALKQRTRQEGPRLEDVDVFATRLEEVSRKVEPTVQTHKGYPKPTGKTDAEEGASPAV